jgi:hypothetical protein
VNQQVSPEIQATLDDLEKRVIASATSCATKRNASEKLHRGKLFNYQLLKRTSHVEPVPG